MKEWKLLFCSVQCQGQTEKRAQTWPLFSVFVSIPGLNANGGICVICRRENAFQLTSQEQQPIALNHHTELTPRPGSRLAGGKEDLGVLALGHYWPPLPAIKFGFSQQYAGYIKVTHIKNHCERFYIFLYYALRHATEKSM